MPVLDVGSLPPFNNIPLYPAAGLGLISSSWISLSQLEHRVDFLSFVVRGFACIPFDSTNTQGALKE